MKPEHEKAIQAALKRADLTDREASGIEAALAEITRLRGVEKYAEKLNRDYDKHLAKIDELESVIEELQNEVRESNERGESTV